MISFKNFFHNTTDMRTNITRKIVPALILALVFNNFALPLRAAVLDNNKTDIRLDGFVLTGTYQSGGGKFTNGNAGAYVESSCVPVLIQAKNKDKEETGDINLEIVFDYTKNGKVTDAIGVTRLEAITSGLADPGTAKNLSEFTFSEQDLKTTTQFQASGNTSVQTEVTGPFSGETGTSAVSATDFMRHYNILLKGVQPDQTVYVLACGRLGVDAGEFPGSTLSVKTGGGGGNLPIQGAELLKLPSLTIQKTVSGGTAKADQWAFDVAPAVNGQTHLTIPANQSSITIPNVSPDGTYVITESLGGPANYSFTSGEGTNCAFQGATASASLVASKEVANATCSFTNTYVPPFVATTGTLVVIKKVINDSGSNAQASDFTLNLTADGQAPASFTGDSQGTTFVLTAGAYTVSETAAPGYSVAYSPECSGNIVANTTSTCTVTNDDLPVLPADSATGTVTIVKTVINDNGRDSIASNFTLTLTASGTPPINFAGNDQGSSFIVPTGAYSVTEAASDEYQAAYSIECQGTLGTNETKTCTVTNDDTPLPPFTATTGTITVIKTVINDNGGEALASAFNLTLTASGTQPIVFTGDSEGRTFTVPAGNYNVTESSAAGYTASFSESCSGNLPVNGKVICTVTNNDIAGGGDDGGDDENNPPPVFNSATGTLTVIKKMVHRHNRSEKASDFVLEVSHNPSPTGADGQLAVTLVAGNETGTSIVINTGRYSVKERYDGNYTVEYSADCQGDLTAGASKICTVTNYDEPYGSGGSPNPTGGTGGQGGDGSGSTSGSGSSPAPSASPAPTPRVLGSEDVNPNLAKCTLTESEALFILPDVQAILSHLGKTRDLALENKFNKTLTPKVAQTNDADQLSAIQNFINYGTKSNVRLGQGERAGAIDSFQTTYGRLPKDECDWQNVIKIANTKLPHNLEPLREELASQAFKTVYERNASANGSDDIARKVMAYGIRPQLRDLKAEREALKVFKKVYGKIPSNATEWDANRAVAYSGVMPSWFPAYLASAPSRIMSISKESSALALE